MRQETFSTPTPAFTPVPNGLLQRKCACGGHTPAGGECESCKPHALSLQRKTAAPGEDGDVPPIVHDVLRSAGVAMDTGTRTFFEPRFGRDLSGIRLHTDAKAASSAHAVNALAYTVGHDVVFGAGRYAPYTAEGRQLLAHELAHVVQQSHGLHSASAPLRISEPSSYLERQADSAARDVIHGRVGGAVCAAPRTLARAPAAPAKKCPSAHKIPDDVYRATGEAWRKSGHAGATVTEHGGRIVTDAGGKPAIRTGAGGAGGMTIPAGQPGDVTLGTFHTHPYSKAEGSQLGVSFSGTDIESFIAGGMGKVQYVHAGSCVFILDTLDATVRDGCKGVDIKKRWNDKFAAAGGSFQTKVDAAVRAAIKGCGMCYYGTCRPNAKSPIPQTANLA
jgi:hypothetical protein